MASNPGNRRGSSTICSNDQHPVYYSPSSPTPTAHRRTQAPGTRTALTTAAPNNNPPQRTSQPIRAASSPPVPGRPQYIRVKFQLGSPEVLILSDDGKILAIRPSVTQSDDNDDNKAPPLRPKLPGTDLAALKHGKLVREMDDMFRDNYYTTTSRRAGGTAAPVVRQGYLARAGGVAADKGLYGVAAGFFADAQATGAVMAEVCGWVNMSDERFAALFGETGLDAGRGERVGVVVVPGEERFEGVVERVEQWDGDYERLAGLVAGVTGEEVVWF